MKELIQNNIEITWFVGVLLTATALIGITRFILNLVRKRWSKGEELASLFNRLKLISTVFYLIMSALLLSFLFIEVETHEYMKQNMARIIWFAFVMIVTVIAAAISHYYFTSKILQLSRRDKGDVTSFKYMMYLAKFFIYFSGLILIALAVPGLKSIAAAAAAGSAGILALIAGVAAQEGIANLTGGLFIAFFKPFRIGDIVKIGDNIMGKVEDLNLRHTTINNFQNKRIIIPNAIINKENITNYYLGEYKMCEWIEVGISYESDMDLAIKTVRELSESHRFCLDNRTQREKDSGAPIVDVQIVGLGDSSINLKAWVWCASYQTGFKMRNDLYKSIKEKFDVEGITIPYPQQTITIKQDKSDARLAIKTAI